MDQFDKTTGAEAADEAFQEDDIKVTLVDPETNEEFVFSICDEFDFEGETYLVLASEAEEGSEDGETEYTDAVFMRVVTGADGDEDLVSLEDDEFDKVSAYYEELLEESADEDEDDEDDEASED